MMVGDHAEISQAQSCVIGEIGGFVRAVHELDIADVRCRDDRARGLADVRHAGAHLLDDGPVGTGAAQLLQEEERVAAAHIDVVGLGDATRDAFGGPARHIFHIQLLHLETEALQRAFAQRRVNWPPRFHGARRRDERDPLALRMRFDFMHGGRGVAEYRSQQHRNHKSLLHISTRRLCGSVGLEYTEVFVRSLWVYPA